MADVSAHGRFVWCDLITSDPKEAEAFYTKVAGWGTMPWTAPTPGSMAYTMWTVAGAPIGGLMALPSGAPAPPYWLGYVSVPDVDEAVSQAESLGGTTVEKAADIPSVGRFAVLADPQGAMFAVFASAGQTPGHEGMPLVGEFSWHELMTTAYSSAFRFYQSMFGWEKLSEHDMGPLGVYLEFGRNAAPMGGMFNKPADVPMPPNWLQYIHVDSVDRVAELVKESGGTILNGPMDVPGGDRIAQCMDPQAAAFAIHSRKA
jgi:predicted enzyme related to lactoylglutathione lyase